MPRAPGGLAVTTRPSTDAHKELLAGDSAAGIKSDTMLAWR
jgi:hypothetical protein